MCAFSGGKRATMSAGSGPGSGTCAIAAPSSPTVRYPCATGRAPTGRRTRTRIVTCRGKAIVTVTSSMRGSCSRRSRISSALTRNALVPELTWARRRISAAGTAAFPATEADRTAKTEEAGKAATAQRAAIAARNRSNRWMIKPRPAGRRSLSGGNGTTTPIRDSSLLLKLSYNFDLGLEVHADLFPHPGAHPRDEPQHIGRGGGAAVKDIVGVSVADERAAHPHPLAPRHVDEPPRMITFGIPEDASGARRAERLSVAAGPEPGVEAGHAFSRIAGSQLKLDLQDDGGFALQAALAVAESHLTLAPSPFPAWGEHAHPAYDAGDGGSVSPRVHGHASADRPRDPSREFEPGESARR